MVAYKFDSTDPAYIARRERRFQTARRLAWWQKLAEAILKHHEHQLIGTEPGFVATMANTKQNKPPSDAQLQRLKSLAKRFGIEA